jgi:hypothetical protein
LLFICISLNQKTEAQTIKESQHCITIVGTIHTGSQFINHHTLYRLLDEIKPDIVFREQSEPYKHVFGLRTGYFLRLIKPSIEQLSLQRYTQKHRQVIVIPFDTMIPQRRSYIANNALMEAKLDQQLDLAIMTKSDSIEWNHYKMTYNNYYTFVFNNSLAAINQDSTVSLTRELYHMMEKQLSSLVSRYSTDSTLLNWFVHERNFWLLRNQYMVNKISQVIEANPGKKLLVMTGLNHKYILIDLLQKKYGKGIQFLPVQ